MLTVSRILCIFKDLNDKHFNGSLPHITIRISNRSKRTLGCFQYSIKRSMGVCSFTGKIFISISNVPEHSIDSFLTHTIMHEMVHYALFLKYYKTVSPRSIKLYNGHCPEFRRMMQSFGYDGGSKHPMSKGMMGKKEVTPSQFFANLPPVLLRPMVMPSASALPMPFIAPTNRYKVLSNGKVGTFVRESMVYGKKHISLQIEGMLFPFTTAMDNVEPLTIAA
jgi:hypothetical protein